MPKANFLERYADLVELSAAKLQEIWSHYDRDASGYIEAGEELTQLAADMLRASGAESSALAVKDLTTGILDLVDLNADGKLSLAELEQLLKMA